MPYPFLSDEWITAAHALRDEFGDDAPSVGLPVRMNLVVTEVPFGDGDIQAHLDTTSGGIELDKGHLEDPDLTVTVDYATAKAILIDGDAQAGMAAFMAGKIRVEGDMTKLMAMQGETPDPSSQQLAERLRAITA